MTARIRVALLFLVLAVVVAARVGGALAARQAHRAHPRAHRVHRTHAHLRRTSLRAHRLRLRRARVHLRVARIAAKQTSIVRYARHFVGVRYTYGGISPRTGFDCSGFTRFVYSHFGISLPHYSVAQFSLGRRVARLRPGDLVFFDGLGHVGVYVGSGRFIHAPHTGTRVQIDPMSWYAGSYDGARRIV